MNVHNPIVHNPNVTLRAALYLRVSTTRQAEHDVSIPDQKRQGEAYCQERGYQLVETFVEPGNSATNDRRPEFQRMIEAATAKPASFDVVVVHSFSRFFRDEFEMEYYYRKLAKNGVKLVSITQELGDDPIHDMMRRIMSLFDEYQSKENAKHVLRALKENARQGFWNGSLPPIGYRVVAAEQRGAKVKKKLEIAPLHAETIRLIYRLALEGEGSSGQMGVKAIVKHLNGKGGRYRLPCLLESPGHSAISPAMIDGFARRARERIRGGEGGYRRDHLRSLAQRVEVADDAIRIMGSKTELLRTLIAGQVRRLACPEAV